MGFPRTIAVLWNLARGVLIRRGSYDERNIRDVTPLDYNCEEPRATRKFRARGIPPDILYIP